MTEIILLKRIADYFRNWNGIEENAPKLKISVAEMREITSMNSVPQFYHGLNFC